MTSGAASPSPGASHAPSGALLVDDVQERRRALNGELYTREEFRLFYQTPYGTKLLGSWRRYWDQAVREAAAPVASPAEPAAAPAASTAEPVAAE